MHGGKSTGPRTPEGRQRCAAANWKHGEYAAATISGRRVIQAASRIMFGRVKDVAELEILVQRMRGGR
jgi:hypothetical protein